MDRGLDRFARRKKDHHGPQAKAYVQGPTTLERHLQELPPTPENNILYFHIPFCSKICSFCNMNRGLGFPDRSYVNTMLRHIEGLGQFDAMRGLPIDSVYFGGGTPSTLDADSFALLFEAIFRIFDIKPSAEISIETSLTELSVQKLAMLMDMGLNRISVGIQTFSDHGRRLFQRRGNGDFARERLRQYREAGLENVNIDLIYNYPGESLDDFEADLMTFKELDLAGFSLYSLIIMPGSIMETQMKKEAISEEERFLSDMSFFQKALEVRDREGWQQMELTKITLPGRDQYKYIRHRLANGWTIPIGAGAGGNIGHMMVMGPVDRQKYTAMVDQLPDTQGMQFSPLYYQRKAIVNTLQLGYLKKVDLEGDGTPLKAEVEQLVQEGYFTEADDRFCLTDVGLFWGNSISARLWELFPEPKKASRPVMV